MRIFKKRGFTLTEVLVTIAILVLIIGAVYSAYVLTQRAYQEGEMAAELTQNGRVILERMSREIRQAKEIVTELPEERINPSNEILFQDGHSSVVSEENTAQGGTANTVTLAPTASSEEDFYEDMFIKITGGTGSGQIREIDSYDGQTKIAEIEDNWETIPDNTSIYKIDSSYYYIRYFRDVTDVRRQIIIYYFSGDPDTFVPWDATPPDGQTLETLTLQDQLIGEYVTNLEFWGLRVINISLTLTKNGKQLDLETKIFGRNL